MYFSTAYDDAIATPFPTEGKAGLSVWVGPLSAFHGPKVRLLWELEQRRGRFTAVVLTEQNGRTFMRAYREMGGLLGASYLAPYSFLRRRGRVWDSLDFFSSGRSPFMEGANPRLKRLKQAGWEYLVDRVALVDRQVKATYFETLAVTREDLQRAAALAFSERKLSPLIGVAGSGVTKETLYSLLQEPLLCDQILKALPATSTPNAGCWCLLSHHQGGSQLLFYGQGVEPLEVGMVMASEAGARGASERSLMIADVLVVTEVLEQLVRGEAEAFERFFLVSVAWHRPPGREIPIFWRQTSALPGGDKPSVDKLKPAP